MQNFFFVSAEMDGDEVDGDEVGGDEGSDFLHLKKLFRDFSIFN
jgi:hypothetical protein